MEERSTSYTGGSAGTAGKNKMDQAKQKAGEAVGQAKQKAGEAMDQAKDKAGQAVDQAKQKGTQVMDQARDQIRSTVSTQKETAADSLGSVANALRQSVDNLRTEEHSRAAGLLESAAGAVESASTYLRDHDVEDLTRQVEDFGRRQPALFLGAAFALGFMAARFLKSGTGDHGGSGYQGSYGSYGGAYSEPRAYDTQYGSGYYSGAPTGQDAIYGAPDIAPGAKTNLTGSTETGFQDLDEAADREKSRTTLP